jgi:hypothetical protein
MEIERAFPLVQPVGASTAPTVPVGRELDELAGIQYAGLPGISAECQDAVIRLVQCREHVSHARILSHEGTHCLLLTVGVGDLIAIKSGFGSGYGGEGPHAFSYVLQLLETHGAEIDEYFVPEELLDRLDASALRTTDLETLDAARPVRPTRWHDYVLEGDWDTRRTGTTWREFLPVIPFAIIDARLADLALSFWEGPDDKLMTGYRRLEDLIRERTGLTEHGGRLFHQAFLVDSPPLCWNDVDPNEQKGRGQLFGAVYMAFRNPRAHRELKMDYGDAQLAEFLVLNSLFLLEAEATNKNA